MLVACASVVEPVAVGATVVVDSASDDVLVDVVVLVVCASVVVSAAVLVAVVVDATRVVVSVDVVVAVLVDTATVVVCVVVVATASCANMMPTTAIMRKAIIARPKIDDRKIELYDDAF